MVNLLFISNNSKIDIIKNILQPSLKVKIDVVGDFDFGLKDVFEKRPAMVFIQDQIAGVTGESVARHIQMLLGSGAPSFIFMHDGNPKAKPIKGLYDYLIDLSQTETKILTDIQSTLKLLVGPQWQKIYVHPKRGKSVVRPTLAVSENNRVLSNQLVDDFISDVIPDPITTAYPLTDYAAQDVSSDKSFTIFSSHQDQLAEIVSEAAREQQESETAIAGKSDIKTENLCSSSGSTVTSVQNVSSVVYAENSKTEVCKVAVISEHSAPAISGASQGTQSPTILSTDFRIEREQKAVEIAEKESLRAFEAEYFSKTASRKWTQAIVVVLLLCLIGVWYLVIQKPHLIQFFVKEPPPASKPVPATQPVTPEVVVQKSESATQRPQTAALPSFIPFEGHDRSFASKKPGWERYVGTDSEFRVFRPAGTLKAVQVLATKGHVISESRLKTILTELTGTSEYHVTSHEQKLGFQLSHATVNRKADVLIYRKKSAVHAFVVSLD